MKFLDTQFELQDYLRILSRRRIYFIVPFILILMGGIFMIATRTPEYESYCVVQLTNSPLPNNLQRVVPKVTYYQRAMSLKMQILNSPTLIKIIDRLKLDEDAKVRKQAMKMREKMPGKEITEIIQFILLKNLQKDLKVRTFGDDYIEIRVTDRNPESAYNKVKTIMDIFMEEFLERELASIQKVKDFNYQQLEIYKNQLEQTEKKLSDYKKDSIVDQNIKNRVLSQEAQNRINEAIVAIDLTIKEKENYLNNLKSQLKVKGQKVIDKYPRTTVINNYYSDLRIKISQMAELMKHYSWKSSEAIKVNKSINDLRENIRTEFEKYYKNSYPGLDLQFINLNVESAITLVDLEIADRKKTILQKVVETSKYSTSTMQANEMTEAKLEEAVQINRDMYNLFLQQIQGTQIEESIQRANQPGRFNIVEPPVKPLEPSNAGFALHFLLTILFGLIAGAGGVYMREFMDKSIRTVEEVEQLFEIPVIGVIPYLENEPFVQLNQPNNPITQ
jgi:uncharacterized protein involved in exopolysaccharide biosynthesis